MPKKQDIEDQYRYLDEVSDILTELDNMLARSLNHKGQLTASLTLDSIKFRLEAYSGVQEKNLPYIENLPRPRKVVRDMIDECQSFIHAIKLLGEKND